METRPTARERVRAAANDPCITQRLGGGSSVKKPDASSSAGAGLAVGGAPTGDFGKEDTCVALALNTSVSMKSA